MAGGAVASNVKVAGPALTRRQEIFSFALVTSLFFAWGLSYGLIDGSSSFPASYSGDSRLRLPVVRSPQQEGRRALRHLQASVDAAAGRLLRSL